MGKKLTIQDIAHLAGVSKATVSRVLNQKQNVDPTTRELILRIMREQGFVPSIAASGLAGGRTRLVGALVPSLTWPLLPEVMRGVGDVIGRTPYELILYSVNDVNHEKDRSDVIDRIVGSNLAAGLLAVFPGPSAQHLADLHSSDFPVVLIDDQSTPPAGVPRISVDNRVGAYMATRHLIQLGHRRIAHIQGPLKYQVSHDRYKGYCAALAEAGIAFDPTLVMQGDFMPASGRVCARIFLELPERPTAIFAGSDYMAYGAITAATQRGLRVPQDLAVVGFDDNPSSAHMEPALTTVKQPFYELGQRAIELLLSALDASRRGNGHGSSSNGTGGTTTPLRTKLPATLVVRQSCGAACQEEIFVR
jgi:LacI family transcriptional regulator